MIVNVDVIGQKLRIATNEKRFASGTNNFVCFIFHLTDRWNELINTAMFKQGENTYSVQLDEENSVFLPSEIVSGTFSLTLFGAGADVSAKTFPVKLVMDNEMRTFTNGGSYTSIDYQIATMDETKAYIGI